MDALVHFIGHSLPQLGQFDLIRFYEVRLHVLQLNPELLRNIKDGIKFIVDHLFAEVLRLEVIVRFDQPGDRRALVRLLALCDVNRMLLDVPELAQVAFLVTSDLRLKL